MLAPDNRSRPCRSRSMCSACGSARCRSDGWRAHYGRRTAFQIGTVCGVITGLICCLGVLKGSFLIFCVGAFCSGPLCRRASGLSLRRRRYRERCVQAESDFLGPARRHLRRRRRAAARHPDQGSVAALSVRGELSRAGADRGAGGRRAVASSKFRCRRRCRKVSKGRSLGEILRQPRFVVAVAAASRATR